MKGGSVYIGREGNKTVGDPIIEGVRVVGEYIEKDEMGSCHVALTWSFVGGYCATLGIREGCFSHYHGEKKGQLSDSVATQFSVTYGYERVNLLRLQSVSSKFCATRVIMRHVFSTITIGFLFQIFIWELKNEV